MQANGISIYNYNHSYEVGQVIFLRTHFFAYVILQHQSFPPLNTLKVPLFVSRELFCLIKVNKPKTRSSGTTMLPAGHFTLHCRASCEKLEFTKERVFKYLKFKILSFST